VTSTLPSTNPSQDPRQADGSSGTVDTTDGTAPRSAAGRHNRITVALMVLLPLNGVALGLVVAGYTPPRYQAHAYLLITDVKNGVGVSTISISQATARIATKPSVLADASSSLNLAAQAGDLTAVASPDAPLVDLAATAGNPDLATTLADELARQVGKHVSQFSSTTGVQAQVYAGASRPTAKTAPNTLIDALVGLVLGALATGVVYVRRGLPQPSRRPHQGAPEPQRRPHGDGGPQLNP